MHGPGPPAPAQSEPCSPYGSGLPPRFDASSPLQLSERGAYLEQSDGLVVNLRVRDCFELFFFNFLQFPLLSSSDRPPSGPPSPPW